MTLEEKKEQKRLYDIEYRKKNKEKLALQKKEWYINNPEKIKVSTIKNKDNKKEINKKYSLKNKKNLNLKKREWANNNKEKVKISKLKYETKRLKNDPLYKLKHNIACGFRQSLKRNCYTKKSRTHEILGCSYEQFKQYLESKFESWMSWENYGLYNGIPNYGWDIDHVIPTSSAKTEEEVINLNHYSNLQPLCSYVNRDVKRNNLTNA